MAHYAQIQPLQSSVRVVIQSLEVMEINSWSITHLKSLLQNRKHSAPSFLIIAYYLVS